MSRRARDWNVVSMALKRVGVTDNVEAFPHSPSFGWTPWVRIAGEVVVTASESSDHKLMHWVGRCDVALSRLALMPDAAGWDAFEQSFPPWEWVLTDLYRRPAPVRRWIAMRRNRWSTRDKLRYMGVVFKDDSPHLPPRKTP
jgi:hypothetical protein